MLLMSKVVNLFTKSATKGSGPIAGALAPDQPSVGAWPASLPLYRILPLKLKSRSFPMMAYSLCFGALFGSLVNSFLSGTVPFGVMQYFASAWVVNERIPFSRLNATGVPSKVVISRSLVCHGFTR